MCYGSTSNTGFSYESAGYRVSGSVYSSVECRIIFTNTPVVLLNKPAKNGRGGGQRRFRINTIIVRFDNSAMENITDILNWVDPSVQQVVEREYNNVFSFDGNWAASTGGWLANDDRATVPMSALDNATRQTMHAAVGAVLDEQLKKANQLYQDYSAHINLAIGKTQVSSS